MGMYQKEKVFYAQRSIFRVLSDGQWHRNMEIKEKTKLSSRTLAKHLNKLTQLYLIERKQDVESGEYPVPVFYKAIAELLTYIRGSILRDNFSDNVDQMLKETKDPLMILEAIHEFSQLGFMTIMENIRKDKKIANQVLDFYENMILFTNYRSFMFELIEATRKVIDDIDFDKLLAAQAKRQKEASETALKHFTEMGLIK